MKYPRQDTSAVRGGECGLRPLRGQSGPRSVCDRLSQFPMARAFEARIKWQAPERGLFLVVGRGKSPVAAVNGAGGQVVANLVGGRRLLAVLPVTQAMTLHRHPDVALAGSVTVDAARFKRFMKLAGITDETKAPTSQHG
jgi:hypothetical protein